MSWNYAELSKAAKEAGGPEALMDILVKSGREQMVPWMAGIAVVGIGAGIGISKGISYLKNRRKASEQKVEDAKQELIKGIKEYDEEHVAVE